MEEEEVDIFIFDVANERKLLFQVPPNIKSIDLRKKLEELLEVTNFEFRYKSKLFDDNEIISFQEGDTIYIYKKEGEKVSESNEAKTENKGMTYIKLPKILNLFFMKYISDYIENLDHIKDKKIRNIISELKNKIELNIDKNQNIKICKKEKIECNIISYANYVFATIEEKDINYLINLFNDNIKNNISNFMNMISIYKPYHSFFEEDLPKALEKSYLEYFVSGIQLLSFNANKKYFEESNNCQNKVFKYLFHEIQSNTNIEGNNNNILPYSKKPFFGMGIYFTDKLDYIAYKTSEKKYTISINSSFSCNVSQIYYDNQLKKNISDFSYYTERLEHELTYEEINKKFPDKKVVKNGLHFVRMKLDSGQILNENDLKTEKKNGSLIGNEYVIFEREQILPLFNLELKRNESLIIWNDPNCNDSKIIQEGKMLIYQNLNLNAYFENVIENALEIIKRKKHNKIILISNIGLNVSGKRFIELARKILEFPVVALFFSKNFTHLNWISNFSNTLYTNGLNYFFRYIKNYNQNNLLLLKKEVEKQYNKKLIFTKDFLNFPKFIDSKEYKDIIFEESSPYLKKVIIKNITNSNVLCLDEKGNILFKNDANINKMTDSYIWHITIFGNEITFYNNQFYLGIDIKNRKAKIEQFMKTWNFVIQSPYYLIYFQNQSHILTDNNNEAIVENRIDNYYNQLFILNELFEDNE